MGLHDELLDLYGSGKVRQVEETARYQALCEAHQDDDGFEPERIYVRRLKKNLEDNITGQRHQAQVKLCLGLLSQTKDEHKRADYHRLITLVYRPTWSDPQTSHYDHAYGVITGDVLYFLSFTQRNDSPERASLVNRQHRGFIEDEFYNTDVVENTDLSTTNLLAKLIDSILRDNRLSGFFYPLHEGNSDHVKAKLSANCGMMLTFLQIVQGVMFDYSPLNFCHYEYERALQSSPCKKRIFVLAEDRDDLQLDEPDIAAEYRPWFDEIIGDNDSLQLVSTLEYDDKAIRENRKLIKERVVREIKRIRNAMFNEVPD